MKFLIVIFIAIGFIWLLNSCDTGKQATENTPPSKDSLVKRGAYLVSVIGCNDCHSPKNMGPKGPEIDTASMLSGFPSNRPVPVTDVKNLKDGSTVFNSDLTSASGPWGTSFAANITSDETGIGNWTEAQFKNALRKGKYMGLDGGRMLMPPMPWEDFSNFTDGDIEAIFYYLKSTKPVKNVVPAFIAAVK